eukprot:TRINITY_DN23207_c0_g1_i1.p1 TRINITY_DN23207_c0_g1~~TRINITY_DN23207_c0_g1_i1.p1  ORF type:complete len:782 (+),score=208.35 TRINITY_DN23207_c0_g1_i1:65-2410(+)
MNLAALESRLNGFQEKIVELTELNNRMDSIEETVRALVEAVTNFGLELPQVSQRKSSNAKSIKTPSSLVKAFKRTDQPKDPPTKDTPKAETSSEKETPPKVEPTPMKKVTLNSDNSPIPDPPQAPASAISPIALDSFKKSRRSTEPRMFFKPDAIESPLAKQRSVPPPPPPAGNEMSKSRGAEDPANESRLEDVIVRKDSKHNMSLNEGPSGGTENSLPAAQSKGKLTRVRSDFRKQQTRPHNIRSPPKTNALIGLMNSNEEPSKEQLAFYKNLLHELFSDKEKLKSFVEYGRSLGSPQLTLIISWQTLSSFKVMLTNKPLEQVRGVVQTSWQSLTQAVIFPAEIQSTIQAKIDSGVFDDKLFDDAISYAESVIVLAILPEYCLKYGISVPEKKKDKLQELKKERMKMLNPRGSSKVKKKDLKKKVSNGRQAEKSNPLKDKLKAEQLKRVDQQFQLARGRLTQLKSTINSFETFLQQTQEWYKINADEEQLRNCEKVLPQCNVAIYRINAKSKEKLDKLQSLLPTDGSDQQQSQPGTPTVLHKATSEASHNARLMQRQSSVVADRIWAELRRSNVEKEEESTFKITTARAATTPTKPHPLINSAKGSRSSLTNLNQSKDVPISERANPRVRIAIGNKDNKLGNDRSMSPTPPPPLAQEANIEPSLEELLAEGDAEEIGRILDEIDRARGGLNSQNFEDSFSDVDNPTGENGEGPLNETSTNEDEDKLLEEMDDFTFQEILEGLVTSPRGEQSNSSALENLESKLGDLKSLYSDILGDFSSF